MRVLVTGAAGFIGSHVVAALAEHEVVPYDRAHGDDILDSDALARAAEGCDAAIHLAGVYSFRRADAALMQRVNVEGTRAVMVALERAGVARIVHTSSCATCGPVPGRAATEEDLPPRRELAIPYRATKLAGERIALAAGAVVVNPTVPVGPGDLGPTPTGKMVADVARGRAGAYLARSALNIVAVQDVAAGHVAALQRGRAGERYLLGGENLSVRRIFALVAEAAGRRAPRIGVPWTAAFGAAVAVDAALRPLGREHDLLVLDEVRSGRLPHLFDDAKARRELGYSSLRAAAALALAAQAAL